MKPRLIALLVLFVLAAASLGACAGLPFTGGSTWKEEVLLHDGGTLIVERSIIRRGRHEIGQPPPIGEQTIRFQLPQSHKTVRWTSPYDDELGHSDFRLRALHVLNDTPYVIAEPDLCLAYNKWGRPNPPYVIFRHDGTAWQRIPIAQLPIEFKTFNVMMHNDAKYTNDLARAGRVSAEKIRELNSVIERDNPHLRTILREPTTGGNTGCLVMVRYRGHWIWDKSPTARDLVDRQINRENKKHTPYQGKPDRQAQEKASP
ncbi:MAG TPA: hypothetical protein PKE41_09955 [Candidatus Macondimonas sp.]|nr:hypothetical protein [Candidatus Macondimonas sp.]